MVLTLASSADPGSMTPARDQDPFLLLDFVGGGNGGGVLDHWGIDQPVLEDHEQMNFGEHLIDMDMSVLDLSARSAPFSLSCSPIMSSVSVRKRPIWKNASLTDEFCLKKSTSTAITNSSSHHHHPCPKKNSFPSFEDDTDVSDGDSAGVKSPPPSTTLRRPSYRSEQYDGKTREKMDMLRLSCSCQARNTGKSQHLWEFLLEMLADKRMRSIIAWTGHAREFKVVNSREVAREWGNRKNKPHMNFDKMSRAMRYYYKKNILTHGNKQRLVYSFCQEAICPHYEQIIKISLRTRPSLTSSRFEGGSRMAARSPSPDPPSPPPPSRPASTTNSGGRIKCERVQTSRTGWTPRRLDSSRVMRCDKHTRTIQTAPWKQPAPIPKIKINTNLPLTNDCFKFS
eukprot:sb/3465393/